ncbi:MAG: hypothetical protein LBI55_04025 [Oscillospiraceae bacterium]|jgi:flagellar biosynthesis regulator FlbT|nr:hypothetical protein [Oscillospiraceae bacterium]
MFIKKINTTRTLEKFKNNNVLKKTQFLARLVLNKKRFSATSILKQIKKILEYFWGEDENVLTERINSNDYQKHTKQK